MNPANDPEEKEWLQALGHGDENALRRIFDCYYSGLLSDVDRIIPDENTAKDIVQEVFVELWRKRKELAVHSSLRAYLRRAAVNRALNYLKVQKRFAFSEPETQLAAPPETILEGASTPEDLETVLHDAIQNLPEKCRVVFVLSKFEQFSHKEIAEQLDISVKTIENQITKAMKILRSHMIQYRNLSQIVIIGLFWCLIA